MCVVYLIVRSWAGVGLTLLGEMCVVYLLVRSSAGLGLTLLNSTWGDVCCLLNCKVFDGSRVNPT